MGVISSKPRKPSQAKKISAAQRVMSAIMDRVRLAQVAGLRFAGERNYYQQFGYKVVLKGEDFLAKYGRQDIASRVVDAPPDATWSTPPEIIAPAGLTTTFNALVKQHKLWTILHRVDRLSRMGRYSGLLIGTKGQAHFPMMKNKDVLYLRSFHEDQIPIATTVDDTTNPRFGLPEFYDLVLSKEGDASIQRGSREIQGTIKGPPTQDREKRIHWTRMLHIVENPVQNDVYSQPIMEKVFNILDDILKVTGGTAEAYWLTANRGLQADIDKDMELDKDDAEALADELDEYQHQLRRILRTRGVTLNDLGTKTPDPKNTFEVLVAILSGATGIPKRILLGSEAGQLASEQDRANWAERIQERRNLFAEPFVLNPFVDRLQEYGLLPEGDYEWKWPEAFKVSPLERSQTMAAQARAVGNLSRQTGNKTPMQLLSREESREIIGFEGDLDESEVFDAGDPDKVTQMEQDRLDQQAEQQRQQLEQQQNQPNGSGDGNAQSTSTSTTVQ